MGGPSPFVGRSGAVYGRPQAPSMLDISGLPPAILPYLRGFAGLPGLSPQMIQRMLAGRFVGAPGQFGALQLPPEVLAQLSHMFGIKIPITPTPGQPVPVTPPPTPPTTPPTTPPAPPSPPGTPHEGGGGPEVPIGGPEGTGGGGGGGGQSPGFSGDKGYANVPDEGSSDLEGGFMGGEGDLDFSDSGSGSGSPADQVGGDWGGDWGDSGDWGDWGGGWDFF